MLGLGHDGVRRGDPDVGAGAGLGVGPGDRP